MFEYLLTETGIVTLALNEPSAAAVNLPSDVSVRLQPLGLTRLPRALTQNSSTPLFAVSPLSFKVV